MGDYLLHLYTKFCLQVYLLLAEKPHDIVITWSTRSDTGETLVEYGDSNNLTHQAVGSRQQFVDGGDKRKSQFIHRVIKALSEFHIP